MLSPVAARMKITDATSAGETVAKKRSCLVGKLDGRGYETNTKSNRMDAGNLTS